MSTPRAALYARQSLDVQEGIERQLARARKLVEGRGWALAGEYIDNDTSASKRRGSETAWGRLLHDAAAGTITHVVAVDLDRLIRSTRDLLTLIDAGLVVVTVDGEIDLSTADGEFRATLLASLARFEVRRKSERQVRANEHRASQGRALPGRRPFGFESDRTTIRESEAQWIRWAVQTILDGGSVYAIRKRFNEDGVTTATGRAWLTTTVRQMLLRESNAGLLVHHGQIVADGRPAIVERAEWETMRDILEHPDRKPKRGPKAVHIGTGVVTCAVCGSAMRYRNSYNGRAPRYVCTRERLAVRDKLQHPTALAELLENVLGVEVFDALVNGEPEQSRDDAAPLRAERADLARRRAAQQSLIELPGADLNAIAKRIAELGREIDALDIRISEAVSADARVSLRAIARNSFVEYVGEQITNPMEPWNTWLPRWHEIEPEKRIALIRDVLGPITLDFHSLTLTRSGKRISLEETENR